VGKKGWTDGMDRGRREGGEEEGGMNAQREREVKGERDRKGGEKDR
jgi:hypothetical protein